MSKVALNSAAEVFSKSGLSDYDNFYEASEVMMQLKLVSFTFSSELFELISLEV